MLSSIVCRYEHFESDWYVRWASVFGFALPSTTNLPHRKQWEYCAIAQALDERGMLADGRTGLGFAVGREPLSSAFAARGCKIRATDLAGGEKDFATQHAASVADLFFDALIPRGKFDSLVSFQFADMRDIKGIEREHYDFVWSSCSFEHLGSLKAGADFVVNAVDYLKPGGIAVHTTEFNVSSNDATATHGGSVIYRQRDIEDLDRRLRSVKCGIERVDYFAGDHPYDLDYDTRPYSSGDKPHVKLLLAGHVATSILIIVRKGQTPYVPTAASGPIRSFFKARMPGRLLDLVRRLRAFLSGSPNS